MDMLTILHRNRDHLLHRPNVVGCGLGWKQKNGLITRDQALCVYVERKLPPDQLSPKALIPSRVGAAPTDVVEVGRMRTLSLRTRRLRPAPGGVSISHYRVTAGTLGAVVRDRKTGEWLVLSNNHVLANGSDGRDGRAQLGDPILQPGSHDGGLLERDRFGRLVRFVPLRRRDTRGPRWHRLLRRLAGTPAGVSPGGTNRVDAALVQPEHRSYLSPEIMGVGHLQGIASAQPGMAVVKSGRTTGVTRGQVQSVHVTMMVYLSNTEPVWFEEQILTTPMVEGGDSGALLVSDQRAVGLLFAGSDRASLANPIELVLDALGVELV